MTIKNRSEGISRAKERAKHHESTVITESDGDIYIAHVEYPNHHTFRVFNQSGETYRGVYYADSKRGYTFLHRHENIEDILSTTEHENLHAGIFQCREWEFDEIEEGKLLDKHVLRMDDNEEHNMIRIALQEEEYFGE